ncbi:hypothetical protein MMC24_000686 [Lignoscripta atroalba]|nr:hypothetical protein [Lignoscripta atroalba]
MDGQQWKTWRNVFNPGFSANHLMTLVPDIVRESAVFCKVLQSHAQKQDVFAMKGLTDNLAMDVIGRVVLDTNLNSQQSQNKMVHALRRQMRWLAFGDEGNLQRFHPLRPFVHAYNAYQMDSYLSPELDSRFAVHQESEKTKDMKRSKSVIDLALTAYLSGKAGGGNPTQGTMDSAFKTLAMNQIKLFLFSGHDTTSSSICYIFYLLSTNPTTLSHVRAEHDQLFGSTPSEAASLIASDPYLLNQLPYTTAVIKESMRLFPAASTTRSGEPGFSITDFKNGNQYPTDDCLVWLIPQAIQRDPAYWPHPDRFLPERWLTSPGDLLHPVKGAWRPFENGPRACIGQELAMLEMKIVMVLTCREFDISAAYGEVDGERKGKGKGTQGVRTVDGERAYQIEHGQPSGNLPCRVKRAV